MNSEEVVVVVVGITYGGQMLHIKKHEHASSLTLNMGLCFKLFWSLKESKEN